MYPGPHAATRPDKPAAVMLDTGETLTFGELDERSAGLARVFHDAGLRTGDVVALLSENDLRMYEVYWAALQSGLYITVVNYNLAVGEIQHIARDSGAVAVVASGAMARLAVPLLDALGEPRLALAYGDGVPGYASYDDALASRAPDRLPSRPHGGSLLYSSGTTGRPKGVRPALPDGQIDEVTDPLITMIETHFGVGPETTYLSPAPLYHAAPLRWSAGVQALGGTAYVQGRFDAEGCLAAIEEHRLTHGQFVPTMFVRMLKLPEETRAAYDLSSLRSVIHAAAPCPVDVKRQMIDWVGPILFEYYGGTEQNGITMIGPEDWARKPGSVGRSVLGVLHVCDDDTGEELPVGATGAVFWERDVLPFEYLNDPIATVAAQNALHPTWTTLGDIGHVDDGGFLFLTDRKAFTIISGGVNIYPQEIENVLALHPAVHDVAVIGIPDAEMGESVKAFVEPAAGVEPTDATAAEIIAYVKSRIASYKAPRSVEFVAALPRTETGKLVKGELRKCIPVGRTER